MLQIIIDVGLYINSRRACRVVGNIWCVSAGNPSSRLVSDANLAYPLKG